ncbi:hypothetical protein Mapa_002033 [Marchantia paleacea]|nr:hypothetical protein Mapa_002033 [Marchantia paleacea]
MTNGKDDIPACAVGCCLGWGFFGGFAAFVLFLLFGVFALVPAGPFVVRETTLGIVLVVLGATGAASLGGYLALGIPCFGCGFCIDKAMESSCV